MSNLNAGNARIFARQAAGLEAPPIVDADIVVRSQYALQRALECVGFDYGNAVDIAAMARRDGAIVRTAVIMLNSMNAALKPAPTESGSEPWRPSDVEVAC